MNIAVAKVTVAKVTVAKVTVAKVTVAKVMAAVGTKNGSTPKYAANGMV